MMGVHSEALSADLLLSFVSSQVLVTGAIPAGSLQTLQDTWILLSIKGLATRFTDVLKGAALESGVWVK